MSPGAMPDRAPLSTRLSPVPGPTATPVVSVIIPAYRARQFLGAAISGALTQTYPAVEVVVVDDGSDDDTPAIAAAYGSSVVLVRKENGGPNSARNAGVLAASGDLLALCDADDVLLPPYINAMVATWRNARPRTWVTSEAYLLTDGGVDTRRRVLPYGRPAPADQPLAILQGNFVSIFSMFPRAMFDGLGGFDAEYHRCEDWEFWIRAVLDGWRVAFQPAPHALYRWTAGGQSSDHRLMELAEDALMNTVRERTAGRLTPAQRSFLNDRIAAGSPRSLGRRADQALRRGDLEAARDLFLAAAPLAPGDRRLKAKALSMRHMTATGHLWRRRLLEADRATSRVVEETNDHTGKKKTR